EMDAMSEPLEQQWYAFWSPFRSEIAADGFVSQLQRSTGLDYRVVKLKPGVYEVAFAYLDDSDIQTKLAQISSATGLDLSGG
ncbi:MAG: transglycosylase, partial [Gammaproteobacteria bacterium]|nr:transglycosylase [Gammaproteobacteria bacterium]